MGCPRSLWFGLLPWDTPAAATFPMHEPRRESRKIEEAFRKNIPLAAKPASSMSLHFLESRRYVRRRSAKNTIIAQTASKKSRDHGVNI